MNKRKFLIGIVFLVLLIPIWVFYFKGILPYSIGLILIPQERIPYQFNVKNLLNK